MNKQQLASKIWESANKTGSPADMEGLAEFKKLLGPARRQESAKDE